LHKVIKLPEIIRIEHRINSPRHVCFISVIFMTQEVSLKPESGVNLSSIIWPSPWTTIAKLDETMILIDSSATDAPWRAQSSWHRRAKSHQCSSEPIQVGELAAVHGDGVDHLEEHGIAVGGDDEEAVEFLLPPGQHR
jgi:hypothetical protein